MKAYRLAAAILIAAIIVVIDAGEAPAQNPCTRVGQEICQKGQVYRCLQAGSEITPIFQNRSCVVQLPSLNGTWRGMGHQSPAGSSGSDWSIAMTIRDGGGSIEYPSLSCGGTLTQISRDATSAQYREAITHGRNACIDGGTITVRYVNGQLAWTWFGSGGGKQYNAVAVLAR